MNTKRRLAAILAVTVVAVLVALVLNTNVNHTVYALIAVAGFGGIFLWMTRSKRNK